MNPVDLTEHVRRSYVQYLTTSFFFRDPDFRESFDDALQQQELSKGPYVELSPPFERSHGVGALYEQLLGETAEPALIQSLGGSRPLYVHQDEAVQRTQSGRNIVVATGTGSGKTEAFLLSILLTLYRQHLAGTRQPGVRALILYPMNALANDQRERLGLISQALKNNGSSFNFTFGQYIGDTPEDKNDKFRFAQEKLSRRMEGELVLRSEMRATAPDILLTNYSMLEYLLLRPKDSPFFDSGAGRYWEYLVVDEAHQYRGARGIEMAMLIRRLKQRIAEGGQGQRFRCIATSASLISEDKSDESIAAFATELFGEPFLAEDVILGKRLETASNNGVTNNDEVPLAALRRAVGAGPLDLKAFADEHLSNIPEAERMHQASHMIEALTTSATAGTALTARYHFFMRALEGAFITYWPAKRVLLDRAKTLDGGAVFEVALCRQCGQHYLVGKADNGVLREAVRDESDVDFGVSFYMPVEPGEEQGENKPELVKWRLCVQCGALHNGKKAACEHDQSIDVVHVKSSEAHKDRARACFACTYRALDPVREIVYGSDGPHAVIATSLFRNLEPSRRKVLAFADGRQTAAFFAWYLQDSYTDILSRNLLLKSVQRLTEHGAGATIQELIQEFATNLRSHAAVRASMGEVELATRASKDVYREFITDEPRISLQGLGLVKWFVQLPPWLTMPAFLQEPPWSLDAEEISSLAQLLLNSIRDDRAIELRANSPVRLAWPDLELQAAQTEVRIGAAGGKSYTRSWNGGRRKELLKQIALRAGTALTDDDADRALRQIWEHWTAADRVQSPADRVFISVNDATRLNPDWWRAVVLPTSATVFRCDTCGSVQSFAIRAVCLRSTCPGSVCAVPIDDLRQNHYRNLYRADLPGMLRVEEHTAQLAAEKAREYQREFREGHIHVLSCSTTFELGVDLGDLDSIFLRNVPPEPFNYAQRVGRSGRRSAPGLAITYCQRRPHDLYYFRTPERMLSGKVRSIPLKMENEKIILRHMAAVALSTFFRANDARFQDVASLLADMLKPRAVADVSEHIRATQAYLESVFREIVPNSLHDKLGLLTGQWIEKLTDDTSSLSRAMFTASSDYATVLDVEQRSVENKAYSMAKWAQGRARQIAGEDVLSFLSRHVVIPKYGFPVDVVELDTQPVRGSAEGSTVALSRDLSIAVAEFAPGAKVVANKQLWTSAGLKRVAEKEWPKSSYQRCARHNTFRKFLLSELDSGEQCCSHAVRGQYVEPIFGFTTNLERPGVPKRKSDTVYSTRPYFLEETGPQRGSILIPETNPVIEVVRVTSGRLVVLCEGRKGAGFYLCASCGAGFGERKAPSHKSPFGRECSGRLDRCALGHEFETDILQIKARAHPRSGTDVMSFSHSLAAAIVEGASDVLDVPPTDLNATIAQVADGAALPPIVLYDDVPGGAGLVAQLENPKILRAALGVARDRVDGRCGCEEESSCYGCLRSYRNQFLHHSLSRGPVFEYITRLLAEVGAEQVFA